MSISSRDKRTRRVALNASLTALAMILSYLEVLLPIGLIVPIPGFRLGLANLVVLVVFFELSKPDAALISATRIFLMGLLFGTVTSLFFSAMGGLLSYLMLLLLSRIGRRLSYLGISILSAAAHNCGQIIAASLLFGTSVILSYLPVLLIASVLFGGAVGLLLNLLVPRLTPILRKGGFV